jgi:hypothetical protein
MFTVVVTEAPSRTGGELFFKQTGDDGAANFASHPIISGMCSERLRRSAVCSRLQQLVKQLLAKAAAC